MGLLGTIFKKGPDVEGEMVTKGFEESNCSMECDGCFSKFPKSVGNLDESSVLWNLTKPYGIHLVVPTGKTDWPHDACSEAGKIPNAVARWGEKHSGGTWGNIKVTVSSLSPSKYASDDDHHNLLKGDVLILPYFIWVKDITVQNVGEVLDIVVPEVVSASENDTSPPASVEGFPDVEVSVDENQSFVFLCSHKTRDKRCGITAPIMKKEMDLHLRDLGLIRDAGDHRPGGIKVSFINHVGGHKFAANVIIYLKKSGKNIWFARCTPNNAVPIIDECILNGGKIWPDKTRLIQKFKPIEW